VGGSIGLAVAATLLSRFGSQARTALVAHLTPSDPAAVDRLRQAARGFAARGYDPSLAHDLALRAIDGAVARQASLLAFERVFLLAGLMFLLVLPLLAFLKTPDADSAPKSGEKISVHVEV
jgi:DHA2 family multidrug resistance protein